MRLVVIGGVAAGLSAAARARRVDGSLEIVVLERGEHISYGACSFPYYVEGRLARFDELVVYTADYFERERKIQVRTGVEVTAISHPKREVRTAAGERIRYDKLVIATGARQRRKGLQIEPGAPVFTINAPADTIALREHLDRNSRRGAPAAVIGGGYIGLEAVEMLRARGFQVTLHHSGANLLKGDNRRLTELLVKHLERFHVEVRLGERVDCIEKDRVKDRPCELVIVASGLTPNVEIAAEAGVQLGRSGAIAVSEHMETNLHGVYAAGDCAETFHLVTGRPVWTPLGTTANKMGRVAGACAAGARERFPGIVGTAIVRVCGLAVAITGLSSAQAAAAGFEPVSVHIEGYEKAKFFRGRKTGIELVADCRTGRLLGGTVTGEDGAAGRINVIATALAKGMTVDEFKDLDLAYAPPYAVVWDPLLIAAQQLLHQLR